MRLIHPAAAKTPASVVLLVNLAKYAYIHRDYVLVGAYVRIIFVGNGNQKFDGLRHFGYDTRIFNGLVRNGHCVYFFSDRDEVRYSSPFGKLKLIGRKRTNEKLIRVAENMKADALVLAHVDTILPETFEQIKKRLPDIRIAQIKIDALFNTKNRTNIKKREDVVDATFLTTGGDILKEIAGKKSVCYFIPNFTDSSIETGLAHTHKDLPYDVACFMHVDSGYAPDEKDRLRLANGLTEGIKDLKTCYGGFNGLPSARGPLYIDRLSNSAMGLNLSKHISDGVQSTPASRFLYSSDRIAHFMGNGCLTFTQAGFGLENLYKQDEVIFFDELPDLIEKVTYYKKNPATRQMIAAKGWMKAHNQFSSTVAMKYVLERLFNKPLSQAYDWPVDAYSR